MLLADVVAISAQVASTRSRLQKIEHIAALLRATEPERLEAVVGFLVGSPRQGRLGLGPAAVRAVSATPATEPMVTVAELDRTLDEIARTAGAGSQAARQRLLGALLLRATAAEQEFVRRLLLGDLRQGALEGVMADAIASAAQLPAGEVRRAIMLAGDIVPVARSALTEGRAGLAAFRLQLFRPVQPMLAQTAAGIGDALERLGSAALEWKLDGARIQVHKDGDDVAVFTRRMNDVTAAVPEVVAAARTLPIRRAVLDGETIALRADGTPWPFQTTMRRFGRKLDVETLRTELPLSAFLFDVLHLDGRDWIDEPDEERHAALVEVVPASLRVPRLVTAVEAEAEGFFDAALHAGHEGLLAKALDAGYEAGRRGAGWLKIKPSHTLDLVILAAEWGSGRRSGWLSNLHLGARNSSGPGFVMLGKTFKGLTDEMLAWQTAALQERAIGQDGPVVMVRPELVVEVAFDGVQQSPQYPGGVALRFARVKRYRPDKRAEDADTLDAVLAIHAGGAT